MLVLTRKVGEEVIIGHNIRVAVLRIQGSRTKLGIVGPKEVPIRRCETAVRIAGNTILESCVECKS